MSELKVGQVRKWNSENGIRSTDDFFDIVALGEVYCIYRYENKTQVCEYTSSIEYMLKESTEVKEKEIFYQVFFQNKESQRAFCTTTLYRSKDDFLSFNKYKEHELGWIELKPVVER